MPKRKKLPSMPDYTGTSNNQQVQKSTPLQSLAETPLTLPELKILDVYLSRINSHDPDKRYVRFEKGELEKLLGVTRILKDDLDKRLDNLFVAVTIRDENKPKNFTKIGLFAKAEATQDDDGLWKVDLACTQEAMEYIFNIENLRYLRYRLKNIIDLTSRYSYILYLYLENNRFRKSWEIDIDELKKKLNCTAESYNQYKWFNNKILKKCQQEIHEKTDLRFEYSACRRKGRKYTAIRFTVATQPALEDSGNQMTIEHWQTLSEVSEPHNLWKTAFSDAGYASAFTADQIDTIDKYLVCVPESKLPKFTGIYGDINFGRYHYIAQKLALLKNAVAKRNIKDQFKYLLKMIQTDAGIE